MSLVPLRLKKNEERRLRAGHLWIYSNEVDVTQTPLRDLTPGQQVSIETHNGKFLGCAYVNPNSLICARLYSRRPDQPLDSRLLTERLQRALALRERVFDKPFYRLAYGESDGLPGLVVDRFGEHLSVQLNTAGMDVARDQVVDALNGLLRPASITLRNDSGARQMEGLPEVVETAAGNVPEQVLVEENGVRFHTSLTAGQKTGWFYDHRMNRSRMQRYARACRVLDVFAYVGGWGLQAAAAGAREVFFVESSAQAVEQIHANAALNGFDPATIATIEGDAFQVLKDLRTNREQFDLIVVDPPAFIRRKKDMKEGLNAYRRINEMAMQLLARDGVLVSASCSYPLGRLELTDILLKSARHLDRELQIVEHGHQGPDHPIHPAIIETEYLKSITTRIHWVD